MRKLFAVIAVTAAATGLSGCISYEKHATLASPKPYPLGSVCVVTGHTIDAEGVTFVTNGQTVRLCCADCRGDFDKTPAKFLAKLN